MISHMTLRSVKNVLYCTLTRISDQIHQLHDTIDEEYIAHVQIERVPNPGLGSTFSTTKRANNRKL